MEQQSQDNPSSVEKVANGIYGTDSLIGRLSSREKEQTDAAKTAVKKIEDVKYPDPPKEMESPKPENYSHSPMEMFGSGAMWLATFGSLLTKRPLTNALNSATGVMKAYQAKDDEAFQKAMEKWKLDTQNAKQMVDYQKELYKDMTSKTIDEQKILASAYKDEGLKMAIEARIMHDHDKASKANGEHVTMAVLKQEEYERRKQQYIDDGEDPAGASRKAFDEVLGTSAEQKQIREERETTNVIAQMDRVVGDIKKAGVISTGAASIPGKIIEYVGGIIDPKTADTRISRINSQIATLKLELATRMKAGRLKLSQEQLDEMIPSKGFNSVAEAVAGIEEIRNTLADKFDLPTKEYNFSEGNTPGVFENASKNVERVKNIENKVTPQQSKSILDQFKW